MGDSSVSKKKKIKVLSQLTIVTISVLNQSFSIINETYEHYKSNTINPFKVHHPCSTPSHLHIRFEYFCNLAGDPQLTGVQAFAGNRSGRNTEFTREPVAAGGEIGNPRVFFRFGIPLIRLLLLLVILHYT
ncbi:hypothetical protein HanRHA438_Chr13g0602651 [Helianthus annuus]|nr:hypothetical protein HanHA89_Chr13g0517661 [Helianthus annuus]KAJ0858587.1 hypothetical protein HanRHA438_Chr13g0602651 [Helianthus annuus]